MGELAQHSRSHRRGAAVPAAATVVRTAASVHGVLQRAVTLDRLRVAVNSGAHARGLAQLKRALNAARPQQSTSGSPAVVQRTIHDLLEAQRFQQLFGAEAREIFDFNAGEFRRLSAAYPGGNQHAAHADPNVERATTGMHHDMGELYSHAAGYMYQRNVLRRLLGDRLPAMAGSSNRTEPDIMIVPHAGERTAIEVKTTTTASMRAAITGAVQQLVGRDQYQHGQIYIRTTDYDATVREAPAEDPFPLVEAALGAQARAFVARERAANAQGGIAFRTITAIVEIGTPPRPFARVTWNVQPDGTVVRA
jgi:hypothetical protein